MNPVHDPNLTSKIQNLNFPLDLLLALIFPRDCSLCGEPSESYDDGVVCADCWHRSKKWLSLPISCLRCGWPAPRFDPTDVPSENCLRCRDYALDRLRMLGAYHGAMRAMALNLKRQPFLPARVLRLMEETFLKEGALSEVQCIVPVPLHAKREGERGFNQAELLAEKVARITGLPCERRALARKVETRRHRAGMDSRERNLSLKGAFTVVRPGAIRGRTVLLVDDVFTTGATSNECARTLKSAGASRVCGFTLARVVD